MNEEELIKNIINCAYKVRLQLSAGYLESVYKNALIIELKENGISVEAEVPVNVHYKKIVVGEFKADLIVENKVIIELKAVQNLILAHEVQLVNYLTATQIDNGLLMNFGSDKVEIRRKFRIYKQQKLHQN